MSCSNRYLFLAVTLGASFSALAQDADKGGDSLQLTEVTVTAQRREERLQDVPLSISAFDQKSMEARGVRAIDDLARLTPGLTFARTDFRNQSAANISIRGIDSTSGASTTGIYIDDTPIQVRNIGYTAYNAFPQVFDLERVEVLRGPQGTLFGAGSEGGTVRFITPQPSLTESSALARAEVGTTRWGSASYEAGFAFGAPIVSDKLGFRASVRYREDGGWVDRVDYRTRAILDKDANSQDAKTVNLALAWAPADNVRVTPSVFYQQLNVDDTAGYWTATGGPGALSNPDDGKFLNGNAVPNRVDDKFVLPALKVEWELPSVSLVSSTSYFHREVDANADYTWFARGVVWGNPFYNPGSIGQILTRNSQNNITQEVRLQSTDKSAKLSWVGGVFFSHANQFSIQQDYDPQLPADFNAATGGNWSAVFPVPLIDGVYIAENGPIHTTDKQTALFGQVDYKVTDALKLTAGLRVSKTEFSGERIDRGPVLGVTASGSTLFRTTASVKETPVTPKAGVEYAFNRDNMLYGSIAKGYRVGGLNGQVGILCTGELASLGLTAVPSQFSSDYVWSYEVGSKNTFADGRVQMASSVYYIDWSNIQQTLSLSSCVQNYVQNLGSAKSYGGDIQASVLISEGLEANIALAANSATFSETVYAGATAARSAAQDGNHLLGNPWSATVGLQYRFNAATRPFYLRADFSHLAKQDGTLAAQDPRNGQYNAIAIGVPQVNDLNLRAGVTLGNLDLSLFGKNVLNDIPVAGRYRATRRADLLQDSVARPMSYGITATYRY